jgi:hypothetical protein
MSAQNDLRGTLATSMIVVGALTLACASPPSVVDEHFALWRSSHVVNYKYVVEQSCMPGTCPPLEIEVPDGSPVSVRDGLSGTPVSVDADTKWLLSIDAMFVKLKTMRVSPPEDILQVDYDPVLGYPLESKHFPGMTCYDCGAFVVIRDFQRT